MAKKRAFSTFSLSFLDIMSCGFGAVALIFLIIKHDIDARVDAKHENLSAEVQLLEEDISDGTEGLVRARNTVSSVDERLAEAKGQASRIKDEIEATRAALAEVNSDDNGAEVKRLQAEIKKISAQKQALQRQQVQGDNTRTHTGDGNRQYLTGLKLDGRRVLILLDASASMLDEKLVNIIRRRNMSDDIKRNAAKWQRGLATVDWLTAQLPRDGQYQIYSFNTSVKAAIANSEGKWLNSSDSTQLDQAITNLHQRVPADGTNLEQVFRQAAALNPQPDNIFLITDGLPTQGSRKNSNGTIDGPQRVQLFNTAVNELPRGVPVNIILAPMEGDPAAAAAFWQLAQFTHGSFISPSKDWP